MCKEESKKITYNVWTKAEKLHASDVKPSGLY